MAAVVALGLVVVLPRLVGGNGEGAQATDEEAGVDASAPDAGLNQEVNVGPLVITVARVDCPGKQLGTPPTTRTATGKYCAVYFGARNTSTQPEVLSASIQLLTDGVRRYGPDLPPAGTTTPTILTLDNGTRELLGVRLNPDQRGSWAMVFDVAPDFTPTQLLLRFTPRSPLVRVSLTG